MEYIWANEFEREPIEVQEELKVWFLDNIKGFELFAKPLSKEDGHSYENLIYVYGENKELTFLSLMHGNYVTKGIYNLNKFVPMFTEGQLRKFIEDKTNCNLGILPNSTFNELYLANKDNLRRTVKEFIGSKDILRAIWELACEIIKEENQWKKIK
jgi:hypothetical protein